MAENLLLNLVKSIRDSQPAKLKVQTTAGDELDIDCIYKESIAPNFFIVVPDGKLPKNIDATAPCTLSLHADTAESLALAARIAEISNSRTIELTAAKNLDPASLREYFRVDIRLPVTISFSSAGGDPSPRNWTLQGQTLDLSATGLLGIFAEESRSEQHILIELQLPNPAQRVTCLGHVVRTHRTRSGRWQIALHFDNIVQDVRDAIIANCLWEQRRQLREKARTAG